MIFFKPFGRLERVGTSQKFRLSLLVNIPDDYDITQGVITSPTEVKFEVFSALGTTHQGPRAFTLFLDNVPQDSCIKATVWTCLGSQHFLELDLTHEEGTEVDLGWVVLCQEGVEELDEKRGEPIVKAKTAPPPPPPGSGN
ncbi:MAG: hypothetical protein AAFR61_11280 [Bacteroidota bacterium]